MAIPHISAARYAPLPLSAFMPSWATRRQSEPDSAPPQPGQSPLAVPPAGTPSSEADAARPLQAPGYSGVYANEGDTAAQQSFDAKQNSVDAVKDLVTTAQTPSNRAGGNTGRFAVGGLKLVGEATQNEGILKAAGVADSVDRVQVLMRPENSRNPLKGLSIGNAALGGLASATGNRELGIASEAVSGVEDTLMAAGRNSAAGWATGIGSGLSLGGKLIGGAVGKAMDIGSRVAQTASSIATKSMGGIIGGAAGVLGSIIGGEAGQKISAGASVVSGALMMAANPVLGVLGILGGLLGLGSPARTSKLSEQMTADFLGRGKQDDVLTRAADGDKNTLKVELADPKTGKLAESQRIKIPGYFDEKSQARQQTTVDVNNDGKMDIVWRDKNRVSVFLNRGDGSFGNADYANRRKQIEGSQQRIEDAAGLVDLLGGTGLWKGGFLGIGSGTDNSRGQQVLKGIWESRGGETRLGKFEAWRDQFVKNNNLTDLKKSFDAAGGQVRLGSFAGLVSKRLASQGVNIGAQLGQIDGYLKKNGRDSLDVWMQGKRDGQGGTRGLQEMVPGLMKDAIDTHDDSFMGTGEKGQRTRGGRGGSRDVPRSDSASKDAMKDGSGVSLRTQTLGVDVDKQSPEQLQFADVNGDRLLDLVFTGEGVQGTKAFLNRGNGVFATQAIDLEQRLSTRA
jgi:hypothetical protein